MDEDSANGRTARKHPGEIKTELPKENFGLESNKGLVIYSSYDLCINWSSRFVT